MKEVQIGEDTYGFHSVFKSVIEVNPNGIVSISPGFPNPGPTAPPWISTLKAVADL